jgi:hypothetical protein
MTIDEFIKKYEGKGIDFDGYYGFQCMDLYQQYNRDVVGAFAVPCPAAADVWTNHPFNFYTKISNTPTAVPQKGDIIIWKKASSLPYGHIAIFIEGDVNKFVSLDQNWPIGSVTHKQSHDYKNVQGWLRPNKFIPQKQETPLPTFVFNDQTRIPAILLSWNEDLEIQAVRGLLGDLKRSEKRIKELEDNLYVSNTLLERREEEIRQKAKEITALKESTPNIANFSVTELITELMKRFKLG